MTCLSVLVMGASKESSNCSIGLLGSDPLLSSNFSFSRDLNNGLKEESTQRAHG